MDKNFLRAFISKGASEGSAGDPIRFVASTEGIKRDGLELKMENWFLDNYRKNPVFLWAHDYYGSKLPLGRVNVVVEGKQLMADVVFDQDDEFAKQVEGKYRKGFLHTVSVGWNFVEMDKKRVMDLLDVSGVPVPGDPDALVVRQYEALKEIVEDESRGASELVWETVAAEMVDVFLQTGDDGAREKRYKALLPKYRRLGKVAPEFLTIDELQGLSEDELTGLFLEGEEIAHGSLLSPSGPSDPRSASQAHSKSEHSERSGAVLSKRNMSDLEQAIALIQSVMERAKPVEDPEEEHDEDGQDPTLERTAEITVDENFVRALEIQSTLILGSKK